MMKLRNVLLATSLLASTSVANATSVFYPTDGDINFIFEGGALGGLTLAIFDEEADFGVGPNLEVDVPELIFWDGVDTLSDIDTNSLTIDGDFVLAVSDDGGTTWTGGDINPGSVFTLPEANTYAVQFAGLGGIEVVVDLAPVPVPAAVWLFGSGLLGLVGVARRRA